MYQRNAQVHAAISCFFFFRIPLGFHKYLVLFHPTRDLKRSYCAWYYFRLLFINTTLRYNNIRVRSLFIVQRALLQSERSIEIV